MQIVAGITAKYMYTHSYNIWEKSLLACIYKVVHGAALVCMGICQFILISQETR